MIQTLALMRWESLETYYLLGGTFLAAYFIGSVPFGLIFAWLAGAGDVRKVGSGNIGATNVLRTGSKVAAGATLLFDAGKGIVAVLLAQQTFALPPFLAVAALGAFIGHLYPVWLGFKGGKGVATFIGIAFALNFEVAMFTAASWIVVARATRYSSLAALVSSALTPVYFGIFGETLWAALTAVLALMIFASHRANIVRLARGEEPGIGRR
jgi:acyl phosphate:glycerol-3-phosphate acyltransferase